MSDPLIRPLISRGTRSQPLPSPSPSPPAPLPLPIPPEPVPGPGLSDAPEVACTPILGSGATITGGGGAT